MSSRLALVAVVLAFLFPGRLSADDAQSYFFVQHAVSTNDKQAQLLFDEGLTDVYAFNREAAEAAFAGAAQIDPGLAIAWWGVALAHGPNINIRMSSDDMDAAVRAIANAEKLRKNASVEERALIDALATRYDNASNQTKLAGPYAIAMRKVATDYPDDPDVEALYVESMMDALWWKSPMKGMPDESAMEKRVAVDVQRWPQHIGLLHYFIHFTEPDTTPLAVTVADRLASFNFAPQASHLVHMPSHVYMYVGQWKKMSSLNHQAVDMDLAQAKAAAIKPTRLDYFFHNLDFWYGSAVMSGNKTEADAAVSVWGHYDRNASWIEAARFGDYAGAATLMDASGIAKNLTTAPYKVLFDYGLVCAANGRSAEAQQAISGIQRRFSAGNLRTLGIDMIRARLAESSNDFVHARDLYANAANSQDKLELEDAPPWIFAPRELLAAMELQMGDPSAAAAVSEADLRKHPLSVPSLAILESAYAALGRLDDAAKIKAEINAQTATQ